MIEFMITFTELSKQEMHRIKDLWNQNYAYHCGKSEFFSHNPEKEMFNTRLRTWYRAEKMKVTLASVDGIHAGYCLSKIENRKGSIESIYICKPFRNRGIGKELVNHHKKWFHSQNISQVSLSTVWGNNETLAFYMKAGFFPKTVSLSLKQ